MVAISILLLAIVGPMTIASRGLQSAFYAKEQLVAVYLAQEAVEYVRSSRDNNALQAGQSSAIWLNGLNTCDVSINADGCGFDMRGTSLVDCGPTGSACRLRYDSSALSSAARGMYTHAGSYPFSLYTRVVKIQELINDREASVTVTVTWQSGLFGATNRTVTIQFRIFNQYADV